MMRPPEREVESAFLDLDRLFLLLSGKVCPESCVRTLRRAVESISSLPQMTSDSSCARDRNDGHNSRLRSDDHAGGWQRRDRPTDPITRHQPILRDRGPLTNGLPKR